MTEPYRAAVAAIGLAQQAPARVTLELVAHAPCGHEARLLLTDADEAAIDELRDLVLGDKPCPICTEADVS